jgi:hypothetical protein
LPRRAAILLAFLLEASCARLGFDEPLPAGQDARVERRALDLALDLAPARERGDLLRWDASLPLGAPCPSGEACASGHCSDGVCCNSACREACVACDHAGNAGTCLPLADGESPRAGHAVCPASAASSCGPDGRCDWKGACRSWPAGTVCKDALCETSSNLYTPPAACDGKGACVASAPLACAPYRCAGNACRTFCDKDDHCVPGAFCVNASCGLKGLGASCTVDNECASTHCVDGVCCASACSDQCRACNLPGSLGACATLTSGQPTAPRPACAGSGVCKGSCTGSPTCSYPTGSCRTASCADSTTLTLAASCDGKGSCPPAAVQSCAPYLCEANACTTSCNVDGDCVSSTYCSGTGSCVARLANGSACNRNRQCSSSRCVDGYCCDSDCASQCMACDLAGSLGSCGFVLSGQPHGSRPACAGAGSACGGSCIGGTVCTYPPAGTSCAVCAGSGPFATTPGSCDGAGTCLTGAVVSCGSYQCLTSGTGCRTSCAATTDCWNAYCDVPSTTCMTCFPAGTPVLTPGGPRPIESLRAGDLVQSYDTLSGRALTRPIVAVERRRARRLLALRAGGAPILTTPEHYFWTQAGGWVRARDLEAGDRLVAPDGAERSFRAGKVRSLARAVDVYNLVVREHNVYFVGSPPVLVHSCTTIGFSATRDPR